MISIMELDHGNRGTKATVPALLGLLIQYFVSQMRYFLWSTRTNPVHHCLLFIAPSKVLLILMRI